MRILKGDLGGWPVEGYFTLYARRGSAGGFRGATMAIQTGLPHAAERAREIEGYGYDRRPPRAGRKFCLAARSEEQVDWGTVRALRPVVEEMEPGWIAAVKEASRISNDARVIAAWCELPIQAVVAILLNLEARGELPDEAAEEK